MRVLIATDKPFAQVAVDEIRRKVENAGFELALLEGYTRKQELMSAITDVDAVIIRSDIIDREVLDAAKKLKIIVRAGAGCDNVDLDAATDHDVCVMNTPGQNANAVAELVFGMLLVYGVRRSLSMATGTELKGKKLGILAYGNVGRNVARIARGMEMDIYAYDAYTPAMFIEKDGIKAVASKEELFRTCDIVSIHIPATAETKGSIGFELMNSMPEGAIVVNTARKEVMNEAGLSRIYEERPDFTYLTDVKPSKDEELKTKYPDRYFATPKKMGSQTAEANINAGIAAAEQIVDYINNGNEKYRVNKKLVKISECA